MCLLTKVILTLLLKIVGKKKNSGDNETRVNVNASDTLSLISITENVIKQRVISSSKTQLMNVRHYRIDCGVPCDGNLSAVFAKQPNSIKKLFMDLLEELD